MAQELATAVAAVTVVDKDRGLLRSLRPSVSSAIEENYERIDAGDGQYDSRFVGYQWARDPGDIPPDDIRDAVEQVRAAMVPLPQEAIGNLLFELRQLTRNREAEPHELALQVSLYADRIRQYPADVAAEAIAWWGDHEKFWPAWSELKALMEERVGRRRALLRFLEFSR